MERAFRGVWFPVGIWINKELTNHEKIFLVEIDNYDHGQGCRLGIDHFNETFGYSSDFITDVINSLESKGYISINSTNCNDDPLLIVDNQKYGKRF